jgi:hypothetical protein
MQKELGVEPGSWMDTGHVRRSCARRMALSVPIDNRCPIVSSKLSTSLEERPEYRLTIVEVVMDDIHEIAGVHELGYELPRRGVRIVEFCPLEAKFVRLVLHRNKSGHLKTRGDTRTYLPCHEADGFDNGGLDDLLARENAPSHGIGTFRVGVGPQVTTLVDGVISDVTVTLNMREQNRKQRGVDEEL